MSLLKRLADFFALKRSMIAMLGMVILVGMGERMAERFLPIYLMALGGGAITIGLLGGLQNLLGALYSFPGGYLSDRIGIKKALLVFNLMAMIGFGIVILFPSIYAVLVGALFFIAWSAISLPAIMALVARVLPLSKRTMGVSVHSLVRRVPMAFGPIVGGLFISAWGEVRGVRLAFGAAILMAVVAAVMQQVMIESEHSSEKSAEDSTPEKNPLKAFRLLNPDLRNLLVSDILIRFCEQIPYAFAVVWAMKTIASPVSAVEFGVLTTVEMATSALCYIPVAYWADKTAKKPFVVITFVFFTVFPLMLLVSHSFWPLVLAFFVRGLKEFGEPTRKALILDLAPKGREAAVFGLYYLIRDTIVSLAAFGGALLWLISPATNFLVAFVFGLAGTIWFAVRGRDLTTRQRV
ncbi:MAG: MFS transporter [Candidatus Zixiibacteriota bacterium]